jgi:hypothetical protein
MEVPCTLATAGFLKGVWAFSHPLTHKSTHPTTQSPTHPSTHTHTCTHVHISATYAHTYTRTYAYIHTYQVDEASEGGWSALHVAGIYNSAISAAAAIDSNADVFQRDVCGRTPLHMGGSNNAVETLTHMVARAKRGLLDEVRDNKGNTALHAAAAAGSYEAAKYLLQASADPCAQNLRGHVPHDAASTTKFALANELLLFTLTLLHRFRLRQKKPRLRRLLQSTKPSLGFYPSRLGPHVDLFYELGADFIIGPSSCAANQSMSATLRNPAMMGIFKFRSNADKVKLQQTTVLGLCMYPQLARMGLMRASPASRRAHLLKEERKLARQSEKLPGEQLEDAVAGRNNLGGTEGCGGVGAREGSSPVSVLLPKIAGAVYGPPSSALSTEVDAGIGADSGARLRTQVRGVHTPNTRGGINDIRGLAGQSTFSGVRSSARPQVPMATAMPVVGKAGGKGKGLVNYKVTEASTKLAAMMWGRSWSEKKNPVPPPQPVITDEETAWRLLLLKFVDRISLADANWCVHHHAGPAISSNRLPFPRFLLHPPFFLEIVEQRRAGVIRFT